MLIKENPYPSLSVTRLIKSHDLKDETKLGIEKYATDIVSRNKENGHGQWIILWSIPIITNKQNF